MYILDRFDDHNDETLYSVTKSKEDEMFENLSSAPIVYIYEDPQWPAMTEVYFITSTSCYHQQYESELAITLTPATITTTIVWRH